MGGPRVGAARRPRPASRALPRGGGRREPRVGVGSGIGYGALGVVGNMIVDPSHRRRASAPPSWRAWSPASRARLHAARALGARRGAATVRAIRLRARPGPASPPACLVGRADTDGAAELTDAATVSSPGSPSTTPPDSGVTDRADRRDARRPSDGRSSSLEREGAMRGLGMRPGRCRPRRADGGRPPDIAAALVGGRCERPGVADGPAQLPAGNARARSGCGGAGPRWRRGTAAWRAGGRAAPGGHDLRQGGGRARVSTTSASSSAPGPASTPSPPTRVTSWRRGCGAG